MKTKLASVAGVMAVLAIAGTASAVAISRINGITIQELRFTAEGARIIPTTAVQNPGGLCAVTDFYEPTPLDPALREGFDKALASALLAGRKIDLSIQGCGANNRPAYVIVHLTKDQ